MAAMFTANYYPKQLKITSPENKNHLRHPPTFGGVTSRNSRPQMRQFNLQRDPSQPAGAAGLLGNARGLDTHVAGTFPQRHGHVCRPELPRSPPPTPWSHPWGGRRLRRAAGPGRTAGDAGARCPGEAAPGPQAALASGVTSILHLTPARPEAPPAFPPLGTWLPSPVSPAGTQSPPSPHLPAQEPSDPATLAPRGA